MCDDASQDMGQGVKAEDVELHAGRNLTHFYCRCVPRLSIASCFCHAHVASLLLLVKQASTELGVSMRHQLPRKQVS
jgi:hypothetical protein